VPRRYVAVWSDAEGARLREDAGLLNDLLALSALPGAPAEVTPQLHAEQ